MAANSKTQSNDVGGFAKKLNDCIAVSHNKMLSSQQRYQKEKKKKNKAEL